MSIKEESHTLREWQKILANNPELMAEFDELTPPTPIKGDISEQPVSDHHEIEVEFRGEKVTISREFYRDGEMNYSTSEQDDNAIWSALRAWCEKKGITPFELYPKQPEQPVEMDNEEKIRNFFDAIGDCGFSQYDILRLKSIWEDMGYSIPKQEQTVLPGVEDDGIPGKDFIPVEWVDACERYGKWKIVRAEQPASEELEEAAKEYATKWHKRPDGSLWKCLFPAGAIRDFIAGAEWQKKLDDLETADLLAIAHLQGMEQQKGNIKNLLKSWAENELDEHPNKNDDFRLAIYSLMDKLNDL